MPANCFRLCFSRLHFHRHGTSLAPPPTKQVQCWRSNAHAATLTPEGLMGGKGTRRPQTRPPKVTGGQGGMAATNSTPPSVGQGAPPALTQMPLPPHHLGSTCLQYWQANLPGKCNFNTSRQNFGGYACDCDNAESLPSTFLTPSLR